MGNRAEVELGINDKEVTDRLAALESRFDKFGERVAKSTEKHGAHEKAEDFGEKMKGVGEAVIGAEVLRSFAELTNHYRELNEQAERLGTSTDSIQRMDMLARRNGKTVDDLAHGVEKLIRNLAEAEAEPKIAKALKAIGLNADQLRSADPEEQILLIGDALNRAQTNGDGIPELFSLMGRNAGELIPILKKAREELEEIRGRPVLTEDQVKQLAEFNEHLKDAGVQAQSTIASLTTKTAEFGGTIAAFIQRIAENPGADLAQTFNEVLADAGELKAEGQAEAEATERSAKAAREKAAEEAKIAAIKAAADKQIDEDTKKLEEQAKIEAERVQHLREAIAVQQEHNIESQNGPQENMLMKQAELAQLQKDLAEASKSENMVPESQQLEIKKKIVQTEGEILRFQKEIDSEQEKSAELTKKRAEAAGELKGELEVMRARAAGHDKQATQLEKNLAIQREAVKIAKELNIPMEQALRIAKEKSDLEDKIEKRKKHPGTIHGYTGPTTTGPNSPYGGDGIARFYALQNTDILQKGNKETADRWRQHQDKMTGNHKPEDNKHRDVTLTNSGDILNILSRIAEATEKIDAY